MFVAGSLRPRPRSVSSVASMAKFVDAPLTVLHTLPWLPVQYACP